MNSDGELKSCFVVSPIGSEGTDIRKQADQLLRWVIKPVVKDFGFDAQRGDELDMPGLITTQVIRMLVEDPLVIVNLTGENPNVYYEMAVREATGKPLLLMIMKGNQKPFNIRGMRMIEYGDLTDPDEQDAARDDLRSLLRSLESNSDDVQTPISIALGGRSLLRYLGET